MCFEFGFEQKVTKATKREWVFSSQRSLRSLGELLFNGSKSVIGSAKAQRTPEKMAERRGIVENFAALADFAWGMFAPSVAFKVSDLDGPTSPVLDCHRGSGGSCAEAMSDIVSLFHRDLGGIGQPPLVILHGMLGSSRNWQTTGRDLSAKFHVFALDLRNHGQSPHASEMSYEAMVKDVLAWMDANQLPRISLMGHSMGGKTAMLLACRHPERIERLIIVDIAPQNYHWMAHRAEFLAMNELDLDHLASRAEAELRFEARVDDWAMRKFLVTNLERSAEGKWRWQINLPGISAVLPQLEANVLADTDQFTGPVLWVTGERSTYVATDDRTVILRHFPKATFVTIAGSGHNPHMEKREDFVRAILAM